MRISALVSTGLFIAGALVLLVQLWFKLWSPETFVKLLLTTGVLLLVSLVVDFAIKESAATRKLRDGDDE